LIRKYYVDENYFDHIDNAEKAYIIGLLWSDGCNKTDRGCISLKLQDTDKHILENIKKLMGSNQPLYFSPRKKDSHHDTYSLEISSVKLSKRLEELGMIANKSLSLEFPKWLDESLYSSFILGLIDGDGCISKNNYSVSLVGTSYLLEEIKKIFNDVL
jgi:DNA-binding transcriptional regulator WhiA